MNNIETKEVIINNNLNERYRNVIRSKILKRIYEKNNFDLFENSDPEQSKTQSISDKLIVSKHSEYSSGVTIDQKIKHHLSKEWRKTLERILNYSEGYIDSKLEVTRKDTILFFINTNWPDDEDLKLEMDDTSESKKKRNKKRKQKHQQQAKIYRAVNPIPEYDSDKILVLRHSKIPWKHQLHDKSIKIDINSILRTDFEMIDLTSSIDENTLERLERFLGFRTLVRLTREKIDLNQFTTINFITNFQERLVVQELNQSFNQDLIFNRYDLAQRSKFYKFLNKALNFFQNDPNREDRHHLNNQLFVLSIGSIKLDLQKHPLMYAEDKIVKKLSTAFEKYQKSVSNKTKQKLEKLQQQIDLIVIKLNDFDDEEITKEIRMDFNLLQRLLQQRDQLILDRRWSLIDLIQQWSRFQNYLDQYSNSNDELNEIDLHLDEIENVDLEKENETLKHLISKRLEIQKMINKIKNDKNKLNENQIKKNLYLDDGRLPGEPKFKTIELILPSSIMQKNDSSLNILYSIEVLIGNKIVATFENLHLYRRSFRLHWDQYYRSFPVPVCLNRTYIPTTNKDGDANLFGKLPKIRVYEKNLSTRASKTIAEIQLKSLPSLHMNSRQKSIKIEENFQNFNNDKKEKPKLKGTIEFQMFWSSLPSSLNDSTGSTFDSDLFWMYDEDKLQIKQLTNLDEIDQWLHDIRYMDESPLSINDDQYIRQIELMQLLLRQKYQLELSALYDERKQKLNKLSQTKTEIKDSKPPTEDGTFCTDEEIEQNKRFQMMIHRNQGHVNYRNYRFMPLTTTDLLLSDTRKDELEKSSANILLEFIRVSSEQQRYRVAEDQNDSVKISHDWCTTTTGDGDQTRTITQWMLTVVRVLHQIWEQSIKFDNQGNPIGSSATSINNSNIEEIVSLDEIIKEQTIDTIKLDFPLFTFFQPPSTNRKLNPSRRIRRKEAINIFEAVDYDVQIHLLIQHASNVPLKVNSGSDNEDNKKDLNLSQCSSFVEIKIDQNQQQTMLTSISDGIQPNWNESFKFKTKLNFRNNINLNLFSVSKTIPDSSDQTNFEELDPSFNENSKLERYWLGQLRIPLYLLFFVSKLEGSGIHYSLDDSDVIHSLGNNSKNVDKVRMSKDGTEYFSALGSLPDIRLSLFVTADPPIESNITPTLYYQSLESIELVDYCEKWLQSLLQLFPRRRFVSMVYNLQHRSVLAIRFLAPLKPPSFEELSPLKLDTKTEKKKSKLSKLAHKESFYLSLIIRYVSLIPSLFESNLFLDHMSPRFIDRWSKSNIWMDAVQFLTFRIGCQAEHAILLCCFMLYLDKKAYLVLGTGSLDGPTAYVLVYPGSDSDDIAPADVDPKKDVKLKLILIDPKRGQQFFVQDYNCTMISVDCIITHDNIYANIQKNTHPSLICYNLQRSNHWQPLFNYRNYSDFKNLDISIQPLSINYGQVQIEWVKNYEIKLETYLREQLMNWRRQESGSYTQFNRFCIKIIKRILPELERHLVLDGHRFYLSKLAQIEDQILNELNQIYDVHKIISYPLNLSYSCLGSGTNGMDFDQISRLIYATNLHLIHFGYSNQVEYVIACYLHPYPSNFYSIWIYIAALTSNSTISS